MSIDVAPSILRDERNLITEPREGQVTREEEIEEGRSYLFMGRQICYRVTVLEGPHPWGECTRPKEKVVKIKFHYSKEELKQLIRPQTMMHLPLSNIGIMGEGENFKPGTCIWLVDPEKLPKAKSS